MKPSDRLVAPPRNPNPGLHAPPARCAGLFSSACAIAIAALTGCSGDVGNCKADQPCKLEDDQGGSADTSGEENASGGNANASGEENASGGSGGNGGAGSGSSGEAVGTLEGSGGASSSGGSDASGGGAGAAARQDDECNDDADCDDGLYCNGKEVCAEGECVTGEPVECENDDLDHCAVSCEEGDDEAKCVVTALDNDGDGFASAECEANPGLDCNDDDESINPDAAEVCDGIDNDCNGAADVMDGLPVESIGDIIPDAIEIDVDWSPATQTFGVAIQRDAIVFANLLETGLLEAGAGVVAPLGSTTLVAPRIAWGLDAWGIVYGMFAPNTSDTQNFLRVSTEGKPSGSAEAHAGKTQPFNDIVWNDAGYWLAVRPTAESLVVDRIVPGEDQDQYVTGASLEAIAMAPRIATSQNASAVVWQIADSEAIAWTHLSADLEPAEPEKLSEAGQLPRVAPIPEGFALTWATSSGFSYEARAQDGAVVCGPTEIPFGNDLLDVGDEATPIHTEQGTLVLATDAGRGLVTLFRFDDACEVEVEVALDSPVDVAWSPNLAVGNHSVALAWSGQSRDGNDNNFGVYRVLSDSLCE